MRSSDLPLPILGVHGVPRSGTSWLGQLINSSEQTLYRFQPFFSYAFRGRINVDSDASEIAAFFGELASTRDEFVLQKGAGAIAKYPLEFSKSEAKLLVYKEVRFHSLLPVLLRSVPKFRCLGIVRDPRDVLSSWASAPREFDSSWSLHSEWRFASAKNAGLEENWFGFERWKEFAFLLASLERKYPERVMVVKYYDLLHETERTLMSVFEFAGLDFGEQVASFIENSMSRDDGDAYGVFRDRDRLRSRSDVVPSDISQVIEAELRDTELEPYLDLR